MVSINVPSDKARAVVDAMEHDMITQLASKSDLDSLRRDLRAELALMRQEFKSDTELLRSSMTIRLGSMLVVGLSLLFAALKLV